MSNCERVGRKPNHTKIKESSPLSPQGKTTVNSSIMRTAEILKGESDRKIWIVGPCSVDYEDSILEYAQQLAEIRDLYHEKIEIIMRFYTGKPRTVGGWKGIQNARPGETANIGEGLLEARRLGVKVIEEAGLPIADEMLHPQLIKSFDDIYSLIAIGARSTENQYHREVSSGLDMPVGFKNPTGGDLEVMTNSIKAGQTPSTYTIGEDVYDTKGNELSFGVLRGSTYESERISNYHKNDLRKLYDFYKKSGIKNPSFIVDTNHDNSGKNPDLQLGIMKKVVANLNDLEVECPGITKMWKGFMTESYVYGGNQGLSQSDIIKGKSLTDPCSSIEDTKKMAKYLGGLNI